MFFIVFRFVFESHPIAMVEIVSRGSQCNIAPSHSLMLTAKVPTTLPVLSIAIYPCFRSSVRKAALAAKEPPAAKTRPLLPLDLFQEFPVLAANLAFCKAANFALCTHCLQVQGVLWENNFPTLTLLILFRNFYIVMVPIRQPYE